MNAHGFSHSIVKQHGAGVWGAEQICLATRPHWFRVIEHGAGGLLLMVGGTTLLLFGQPLRPLLVAWIAPFQAPGGASGPGAAVGANATALDVPNVLEMSITWGGVVLAVVGALLLSWAFLSRHFTEYAITVSPGYSGRILKVQGEHSRQTVAVPLGMVNNLEIYEPLLGRVLGWGHIDIETGNDYDADRLEHLPDPRGFYQMWEVLLDQGYGRNNIASGAGSHAR